MKKVGVTFVILGMILITIAIIMTIFTNQSQQVTKASENNLEKALTYIKNNILYDVDSFQFVEVNDKGEYVFDFIEEDKKYLQLVVNLENKKSYWFSTIGGVK